LQRVTLLVRCWRWGLLRNNMILKSHQWLEKLDLKKSFPNVKTDLRITSYCRNVVSSSGVKHLCHCHDSILPGWPPMQRLLTKLWRWRTKLWSLKESWWLKLINCRKWKYYQLQHWTSSLTL
jgi:hypothetical protein